MIRPRFKHLALRRHHPRGQPPDLPESMAEVLRRQQVANEAVVADLDRLVVFLEARGVVSSEAAADDVAPCPAARAMTARTANSVRAITAARPTTTSSTRSSVASWCRRSRRKVGSLALVVGGLYGHVSCPPGGCSPRRQR
jgi:hypothetical protein